MAVFSGTILLPQGERDGWIDVEDGSIIAVGRERREDGIQGVILPGLVNAHTHVGDTFLRDREKPQDVASLVGPGGWKHVQLASADREAVRAGIEQAAQEMASQGTAAFIDFREGGLEGLALVPDLPQARWYGRPRGDGRDEREREAVVARAHGVGMPGMRDHHGRVIEAWREAAREAKKPFAIHVSEARRDDMDAVLALEPDLIIHMVQASRRDLEAASDADIPIVVCPRSNAFFGMRPPIQMMLEAGCRLALGTDNGMLHRHDLLQETALLAAWCPDEPATTWMRMLVQARTLAGLPWEEPRKGPADWIVVPASGAP